VGGILRLRLIFEAIKLQEDIQRKYTGGTVLHFYIGQRVNDKDNIKIVVRKICETSKLPYFTITPTFSICPEHGYLLGEQYTCSICRLNCEVYSRVVGYLRPVDQWNEGKQAEFGMRSYFNVNS
jgi:anaerobic ribonucleoside-triphosphate reductase